MRTVRRGGPMGLACLVAVAVTVAGALPASAAPGDGSAYGVKTEVTLLGQPAVALGPLAAASTDGPTSDTLASAELPGILTTGVINTSAGRDDATGQVDSRASTADVSIGVLGTGKPITAELVEATCTATQDGNFGTATLVGLDLGSLGEVPVDPAPNTVVHVGLGAANVASITFNEQIANDDGGLTVNAIHVRLLGGSLGSVGDGDVIISSATCGPAGLPIPMASGVGLWLSLGVLGLVMIPVGIGIARRRRPVAS